MRQHADGRAIVYGYAGDRDVSGGFLLDEGDDIARAVRRVQGILAECSPPRVQGILAECSPPRGYIP